MDEEIIVDDAYNMVPLMILPTLDNKWGGHIGHKLFIKMSELAIIAKEKEKAEFILEQLNLLIQEVK